MYVLPEAYKLSNKGGKEGMRDVGLAYPLSEAKRHHSFDCASMTLTKLPDSTLCGLSAATAFLYSSSLSPM